MVRVDTVYQRVLAIANKEQRGYVTPLEFNLLANQAQLDVFEQYFYDKNQFGRLAGNDTDYSDPLDILEEKISVFKKRYIPLTVINQFGQVNLEADLPDLYRLGTVRVNRAGGIGTVVEHITDGKEFMLYESNPKTRQSPRYSVYNRYGDGIRIYPYPIIGVDNVMCNYIKSPSKVEWGYDVIAEKALYNASKSNNFEHHRSDETELVIKILELAGIVINKPGLAQLAGQEDLQKIQQEKQ